tara:strand:+ start:507 stop:1442 length:936 start_codon:yes stop_codon:yes gene_type:complete
MINSFLTNICGFDSEILKKEEVADLTFKRFALGFAVIISLSLISTFIVFFNTVNNIFISIVLSFFFTFIIINLYRLIIVTSSPKNIKIKKDNYKDLIGHYIIKLILLLMIFFIISKPIETQIFKNKVSLHLDEYKENLIDNFRFELESRSNYQISQLNFEKEAKLIDSFIYNEKINFIKEKDSNRLKKLESSIGNSKFFFKQISLVNSRVPESYLIGIIILLIVFYPLYLILTDENFNIYFTIERDVNIGIIKNSWLKYSKEQEELFLKRTGKKLVRQNLYQDPPFNRVKSTDKTKYLKKGSLINWFNKDY